MTIGQIEETDIEELVDIVVRHKIEGKKEINDSVRVGIRTAFEAAIREKNSFGYKYVTSDGKIAGYVMTHLIPFPMIGGKEVYVSDLLMDNNQRGKGIGKQLMKKVEDLARDYNCGRVMLNNPKESEGYRRSFYKKLGFNERDNFANFVKEIL